MSLGLVVGAAGVSLGGVGLSLEAMASLGDG